MKNKVIFVFLLLPWMVYCQEYVNKIIPTDFGNVNAFNIYKTDNKYVLAGIYYNNKSTIIGLDNSLNNFEFYHFDSISFSYRPFNFLDSDIFVFAKNRFLDKGLKLLKVDSNFEVKEQHSILTRGINNFPTSSLSLGDNQNIYGSYGFEESGKNLFGIYRSNKDGTVMWNKSFDENINKSILWRLYNSKSNDLLGCYSVGFQNEFEANARIIKLDTTGNQIWKSNLLTNVFDINNRISLLELSDSNIFLTYKKDMHKDPEYLFNYHPYPPTYIWLDKDGHKIREDVLKIDRDYEVYISEVKAGRGDYFYVFGQRTLFKEEGEEFYGFITKYANSGDTIWTHTYRHPDYNKPGYFHYINDLIEDENGDLTVLGAITPIGGKTEVWVFRVNSGGCFGDEDCKEFTLGDKDLTIKKVSGITLYPNPTSGSVTINDLSDHNHIMVRIYSTDGRLMSTLSNDNITGFDISNLLPDIYIVQINAGSQSQVFKIVKR